MKKLPLTDYRSLTDGWSLVRCLFTWKCGGVFVHVLGRRVGEGAAQTWVQFKSTIVPWHSAVIPWPVYCHCCRFWCGDELQDLVCFGQCSINIFLSKTQNKTSFYRLQVRLCWVTHASPRWTWKGTVQVFFFKFNILQHFFFFFFLMDVLLIVDLHGLSPVSAQQHILRNENVQLTCWS